MAFVYWVHLPEHTDMFSQGYIGFTSKSLEKRWSGHLSDSQRFPHVIFYKALKKYGEHLIKEVILEGSDEYCLAVEYKLRPKEKIGWNTLAGGERGSLGVKRSKESCKKQSDSLKGENHPNWGKKLPKEQVEKSVATRKANFIGVSEETRKKLSKSNKGKIRSQVSRDNVSKGLKGVEKSKEHCAAMSKSRKDADLGLWENFNANKFVWTKAITVQQMMLEELSISEIERQLGLHFRSLATISKMIKSGWNPSNDADFTHWLKLQ